MLINISERLSNLGLKVAAATINNIAVSPSTATTLRNSSERIDTIRKHLPFSAPKESLRRTGNTLGLAALCGGGGVSMACAIEIL